MQFKTWILAVTLTTSIPVMAEPVASVDGAALDSSLVVAQVRQTFGLETPIPDSNTPQYNMLVEELIGREILVQQALKAGLDKNAEVLADVDNLRRNALSAAYMQHWMQTNVPTDEVLKAEYDRQSQMTPPTEYKTRHIVVATEAEAKQLIEQLGKGQDFVALAQQQSLHPSKQQGGDLGWLTLPMMLPPYAQTVMGMAKGELATNPVQSPMGWHVIKLEDSRQMQKPSFEEAKPRLSKILQMAGWQQHVMQLRSQANIERQ
ncbi:peptidylprolyl isomerase [Candidatus Albibeggiatoa sp. nov. NOAA]|uniref:peptidylprolyl isomerase n=1 Tax=Candidatus Albibeggiatoa sp. nov. NOAA TaxID=3162724 RepID=UPI0032F12271|nr:peptidylprolyl isomerase [Thiotrichaceae bacterium]